MNEEKAVHYSGIGAREIPVPMTKIISKIGAHMARKGYVLRTGGAEGSSAAFEQGCDSAGGKKFIFLPWRGFNSNNSPHYTIPERAFDIVKSLNPAWNTQSDSTRKLQARYAQVMLGYDLKLPSVCVICYTQGGKQKGGTGQAIKIAQKYNIPVFDIGGFEAVMDQMLPKLKEFLEGVSIDVEGLEI